MRPGGGGEGGGVWRGSDELESETDGASDGCMWSDESE